jgi:hypothetical protein
MKSKKYSKHKGGNSVKIFIQFCSKSDSLFGDRIEIDTDFVPRVGELIDAHDFLSLPSNQVGDFIVLSVVNKLTTGGIIPYITARQWHRGFRHELLQERGWLPPEAHTNKGYDEDDPARL